MKITERKEKRKNFFKEKKLQGALSGARLMHSRNGAIRGRLVNCAVLLLMMLIMVPIGGCLPEEPQVYGQPDEQAIAEEEPFISILVPPIRGLVLQVEIEGEDSYTITAERVVLMIRSLQNPITLDEINKVEKKVHYKAERDLGETPAPPFLTRESDLKSEPPGAGAGIVAFGYTIDDDWVPISFIGEAVNEEAVEVIHRRAKEWFKELLRQQQPIEGQAATVTGRSWVPVWRRSREFGWAPYGVVMSTVIVYQEPQDGSTCHDWFAISEDFSMTPGRILWGTGWDNCRGWLTHNWGVDGGKAKELLVWAPLGTLTGEQSISMSVGKAPALVWTYHQNVTTYDLTNPLEDFMRRKIVFRAWAARRTTGGMNPVSVAVAPQYRDGRLRRLARVTTVGTFSESGTERHIGFHSYIWVRAQDI